MPDLNAARDVAQRYAPALMANRARRYEREFRRQQGVTAAAEQLVAEHGAIVQAGPFAGMQYPAQRVADIDTPIGKLLGIYEHEIQQAFTDALARGVRTFIDVGCADGYYAVGMPYANRQIRSYAFDLASSARHLCGDVAHANKLDGNVTIAKRFSVASLGSIDPHRALMLCDIEGHEAELFDNDLISRLGETSVVIEVHESANLGLGRELRHRFDASHQVLRVTQQSRESATQEFRPPDLHWLICEPR